MSDLDINTAEGQLRFDGIGSEIGGIFDREKLPPELVTSILLDCVARIYAKDFPDRRARREIVLAGIEALQRLTEHYAGGGT